MQSIKDFMQKKWRYFVTVLLLVICLFSFFSLAPVRSKPETYSSEYEELDKKKADVLKLTATSATTSVVITLLPNDIGTPIAEKLSDLSGYFLLILSAIYLEKYLLTITGLVTFKYLIPAACICGIIGLLCKLKAFTRLAVLIGLFGLAIHFVIPASLYVSSMVQDEYNYSIESIMEDAKETDKTLSEMIGEDTHVVEESANQAVENEENEDKGTFGNVVSWFSGVGSKVGNVAAGVEHGVSKTVEGISNTVSAVISGELIAKAKNALGNYIDAVAVMLITSCVIPVLVFVFFIWIIKAFMSFHFEKIRG